MAVGSVDPGVFQGKLRPIQFWALFFPFLPKIFVSHTIYFSLETYGGKNKLIKQLSHTKTIRKKKNHSREMKNGIK